MSVLQLKTFADIVAAVREELQVQSTDTTAINRIKRDINIAYRKVVAKKKFWWLNGETTVQLPAYDSTGTAAVTVGSNAVTLTSAPIGSSKKGYKFAIDGYNEIYTIESHTAGSTSLKLDREYTGTTESSVTYKIWTDKLPLPVDLKETIRAWHDHYANPMDNVNLSEFRRASGLAPRAEGKPIMYYTGDFFDPRQTSPISGLPSLSTRASSGVVKTLVFGSSLPDSVTESVSDGDPVRIRVAKGGNAAYNGDFLIAGISTTTVSNDTLIYVSPIELQESATADTAMTIQSLDQESEYDRYRQLYVYPSINSARVSIHIDYIKQALALSNDSDEPLIPEEDRDVLIYGALERAWRRYRNPEASTSNGELFREKLGEMASKLQDSQEKPRLAPSKLYLSAKRSVTNRRIDASVPGIGGGGSQGAIVKGNANTVTVFGSNGEATSSSVTTTELDYLDGVTSNIQDQLDSKLTALGTIDPNFALQSDNAGAIESSAVTSTELAYLSGVTSAIQTQLDGKQATGDYVTALTGDVTATGPGSVAATVATVGGSAAADIHTAELAANAATNANTASTIVKRDASGNFSAGIITADLTGDVTGNITGDLTGNADTATIARELDSAAAAGTVNIGATNATTVNIGSPGSTVNIQGSVNSIQATNLTVADQLITLNDGGAANSAGGTGIEVEENAVITGYAKVSSDRNSWNFKAPNTAGIASLTPGASDDTVVLESATQSLSNKTFSDPVTLTQVATPATPAAGVNLFYPKSDGKLYTLTDSGIESQVGSGGQGGINLLVLDSSYLVNKTTNSDAETTVGDWVAYADSAGTSPVDMTGGTPNTTITRSTTSPLNGLAHFEMTVSSGATRQGEGISCTAYVPPAYRGRTLTLSFPYSLSGTVTDGDFSLFVYDVTNSEVITPYQSGKLLGSSGLAQCVFTPKSTCTQLRVGIHIARASNTGAVTIKFDDVKVSPDHTPIGLAGSNWKSDLTWTYSAGLGATSNSVVYYRRVGDTLEAVGTVTTGGTVSSAPFYIQLPSVFAIDYSKINTSSGGTIVGTIAGMTSTSTIINTSNSFGYLFIDGSTTNQIAAATTTNSGTLVAQATNNLLLSSQKTTFRFSIPISGWDANVTMAESSTFRISSYLANGTRVTGSAPAALGQYRSYLRNASAGTYTETNGTPTTTPSSNNGIALYRNSAWGTANSANSPTKYDVFVGRNKNVKFVFYSSTGFSGLVDATPHQFNSTTMQGYLTAYDPSTGIATVAPPNNGAATSAANTGYDENGLPITSQIYFDIIVSESALAVGVEEPPAALYNGTATGTLANSFNKVTFPTRLRDTHLVYSSGDYTVPESGDYNISAAVLILSSATITAGNINWISIYKNGSALIQTQTNSTGSQSQHGMSISVHAVPLNKGDTVSIYVRTQNNGTLSYSTTAADNYFSIVKSRAT